MPLPDFRKGQRFGELDSGDMREMVDAIRSLQTAVSKIQQRSRKGGVRREPGVPVDIYNDTGNSIVINEAVGIKTQRYTGATQRQLARCFTVEAIDVTKHYNNFVIAKEEIEYQTVGKAWLAGGFYTKVNMEHAAHNYAAVANGETYLTSAVEGPVRIIWADTGTGNKDAVVNINRSLVTQYRAVQNQAGDNTVLIKAVDSTGAATGDTFRVDILPDSGHVIKNDWVRLYEAGGKLYGYKFWQEEVIIPEEEIEINGWDRAAVDVKYDGIELPIVYNANGDICYAVFNYRGELVEIIGSNEPTPTYRPTFTPAPTATPTPTPTPTWVTPTATPSGACSVCGYDFVVVKVNISDEADCTNAANSNGTHVLSYIGSAFGYSCVWQKTGLPNSRSLWLGMDASGAAIRQIRLEGGGEGSLNVSYSPGNYACTDTWSESTLGCTSSAVEPVGSFTVVSWIA